ncbi:hypothetical protein AB3S75_024061 [Citrus x aurantiifolia]
MEPDPNNNNSTNIEAFLHGHQVNLEELEQDGANDVPKKQRKRRRTSKAWGMFTKLPLDAYQDGKERSMCVCGQVYISESNYGTGNMLKHIKKCPKLKKSRDPRQMILDHSGSIGSCSLEFDQVAFRELLSAAIVKHGLPFQFVEFDAIRNCFEFLNSEVQNISKNTAKADILKAYNAERLRIKAMLEEVPGRICFTSDLWTACTTDGYMSLTAHFIDKNWVLQKRLLNFTLMPSPHTGLCLSEKLLSLWTEWGVEKKVFSITLDNASANEACVTMLKSQLKIRKALLSNGDYLHMRCCAHIINLIVQDGLKAIEGELYKIRESVKFVKASQGRKQKFLECVNQMSLDRKKGLRQDVPTRWNSTYIMLDCALYYKSAFFHLALSDSNYKYCPSEDEWNKLERINNFLVLFYEITCIFSGSKYPTSNLYFPKVFAAYVTLREYSENGDGYMKDMGKRMLEKFLKYWSDFCTILTIAVILDPRYKLQFVEWAYKKVYGENSKELKNIREKLFSLFDEYMLISTQSTNTSPMQGSVPHSNENDDRKGRGKLDSCLEEFDNFESMESSCTQKTQLELYLSEPRADRSSHLDILSFWKDNQVRYPELASMARDVLNIPISTVASESAFSVGGRVLDQFRSSLKPETVESIICSRDWIFGQEVNAMVSMDELTTDILEHNN